MPEGVFIRGGIRRGTQATHCERGATKCGSVALCIGMSQILGLPHCGMRAVRRYWKAVNSQSAKNDWDAIMIGAIHKRRLCSPGPAEFRTKPESRMAWIWVSPAIGLDPLVRQN